MTDTLREAYRVMRTIRTFEERVHREFATGETAGDEASATGVCLHLDHRDAIVSSHRGHGPCIAKGVDVKAMVAEVYGRTAGSCHGNGGSMHGESGVGGGPPLICGTALAAKQQNTGGVGVAFFGDGTGNLGTTLEALNLASAWNLPAIFVAENNGYADVTSSSWSVASDNIADRAAGFGVPGVIVDGLDFFAVHEAAGEAVRRARAGGGPTLIEVKFTHFAGGLDCLEWFRARVIERGDLAGRVFDDIDAEVAKLIDDSVAAAKTEPGSD